MFRKELCVFQCVLLWPSLSCGPPLKQCSLCEAIHKNASPIDKLWYHEGAKLSCSRHPEGLISPLLVSDAQRAEFKTAWVRLCHLPTAFLRDIRHMEQYLLKAMLRTLWALLLSSLVSPHSLSPPEPLQSVWLASQSFAFCRLFRVENSNCFGGGKQQQQPLNLQKGWTNQVQLLGNHREGVEEGNKSLPSTYWQTWACSFKPSQTKRCLFQILTEKWWSLIAPFGSNGFLGLDVSAQYFC